MDYVQFTLGQQLYHDGLLFNSMLEQMEIEAELINICIENGTFLLEAQEEIVNNNRSESVWVRIKEFFKKLFSIFKEKGLSLFESNKKWMEENINKIDNIDFTNMKVEMIPFWNVDPNNIKNNSLKFTDKISNITGAESIKKYSDYDTVRKELYKEYHDENDDLTKGLINLYQVGKSKGPINVVALEGKALQERVVEMKNYCLKYSAEIIPIVDKMKDDATKELQKIETNLKNTSIKEAFCLLENTYFSKTDLFLLAPITEAEAPANNQNNNNNNGQQQQKPATEGKPPETAKATSVKVTNKNSPESNENGDTKKSNGQMSADQVKFINNVAKIVQLNISALMTALENRYKAYIAVLKQLVGKGDQKKSEDGESKDTKGESPKDSKQEKKPLTDAEKKELVRQKVIKDLKKQGIISQDYDDTKDSTKNSKDTSTISERIKGLWKNK